MRCSPDELVADAVQLFRSAGVEVRSQIVGSAGRAAEAILDAADQNEADVLVAGWHPRHTFGGLLEKSVGQKLAERANRPVLLVP